LGIGANTAIFSFMNTILLKKLSVPNPERLVTFAQTYRGERSAMVLPLRAVDTLAEQVSGFAGVFGRFDSAINFSAGESAEWISGEFVTGQYFEALQVKPAVGRLLVEDDVRNAAGNPVCVISFDFWKGAFGGDPKIIGRTVFLNGHAYHLVGVTASGFYGAEIQHRFAVAVPATLIGDFMPLFGGAGAERINTMSWLSPMARLKPTVSRVDAQHQAELVLNQLDHLNRQSDLYLEDGSRGFDTEPSAFGRAILVLMAVVALVLLMACANVAILLLARASTRTQEFGVRLSLGASKASIIRMLFMEALALATAGEIVGLALSFWIENILLSFLNTGRSPTTTLHVAPDGTVFGFSVLLTFATAILFGLVPISQATRIDLVSSLKQESKVSGRISRVFVRESFVVVQIALSLVIIFLAGLLTRTLRTLVNADPGFQPDRVLALKVDLAAAGYTGPDISNLFDEMLQRARTLPGVKAASLATSPPYGSIAVSMGIAVPGYTSRPVRGDDVVSFNFVSPRYFETLGQPILRGRDFEETDSKNSAAVAVVNDKFVRHYFGGEDPTSRIFLVDKETVQIVGVVANTRDRGVRHASTETVYMPEKQGPTAALTLLVRGDADLQRLVPSIMGMVRSIDPRVPVFSIHSLDVDVEAGLSTERILGYLSMLFAALATLLAGVGLYGLLAYSVTGRTREIGIRFVMGAGKYDVALLFAKRSLALVFAGLMIGAPLALISANGIKSLFFGVAPTDPITLLISGGVLALAATLATSIPLRRAARLDPLVALHSE
jgi:predicted permease